MKSSIKLILIITCILSFNIKAKSLEEYPICEYSEAYIEWLNLTPYEQEQTLMPSVCKTEEESVSYFKSAFLYENLSKSSYPQSYDSRNVNGENYISPVRNQLNTGSCWAFAPLATIESYMIKMLSKEIIYSPRHIEYSTAQTFLDGTNESAHGREIGDGGNSYIAASYFLKNIGPILESEMPFENNENQIYLSEISNKNVSLDINGYRIETSSINGCTTEMKELIKGHITDYGAMTSHMFSTQSSLYYNSTTAAFYYNTVNNPVYGVNHAITIVGWDDNYSRLNFQSTNRPVNNGAWIIKNSYGEEFGQNGYMYISYEDSYICNNPNGVTDIDEEIEDNNYYHDVLGATAYFNTKQTGTIYGANVFATKSSLEILEEVSFNAASGTIYEVYINPNSSSLTFSNFTKVGEGTVSYTGYHTIKINETITLDNQNFVVMIKYSNPTNDLSAGVQTYSGADEIFNDINETRGITFISEDTPDQWQDLSYDTNQYPIMSIKASTNNIDYLFEKNETTTKDTIYYEGNTIELKLNLNTDNILPGNITAKLVDKNNQEVTMSTKSISATAISFVDNSQRLTPGEYKIIATYLNTTIEHTFTVVDKYSLSILESQKNIELIFNITNNLVIPVTGYGYQNNQSLTVKLTNNKNEDVSNQVIVSNNFFTNDINNLRIQIPSSIPIGEYTLTLTGLENQTVTSNIVIGTYQTVTNVEINENITSLKVGDSTNLTATISPHDATYQNITWSSSNPSVASINQEGKVIALSSGITTIKVTSTDSNLTDEITIRVVNSSIEVTSSQITSNSSISPHDLFQSSTGKITLTINKTDIVGDLDFTIINSNNEIVNDFNFNIVSENESTTILEVNYQGNASHGLYKLKITNKYLVDYHYEFRIYEPIIINSIEIDNLKILVGISFDLTYTINPSNAYTKNLVLVSDNPSIASVNGFTITTKKIGKTTLTIQDKYNSSIKRTFTLDVSEGLFINLDLEINDNNVSGIYEKANINNFINSLHIQNGDQVQILNNQNSLVNSGYIGTGMTIKKTNAYGTVTYNLIVNGDVNGDGLIQSNDVLLLRRHIIKLTTLTGPYLLAGDVNGDNNASSNDAFAMRRHIIDIEKI